MAKGSDPYSDEVSSGQVTTVPVEDCVSRQNESERCEPKASGLEGTHICRCILASLHTFECFPLVSALSRDWLTQGCKRIYRNSYPASTCSVIRDGHRKWCEANGITSRWASMAEKDRDRRRLRAALASG